MFMKYQKLFLAFHEFCGESALEFLLRFRSSASSSTSPGSLRPLRLSFHPEEQGGVWNRQQQVYFALSGQGRPATHFVISSCLLNITKCNIVCQATQDCILCFIAPAKASFSAVEEAVYDSLYKPSTTQVRTKQSTSQTGGAQVLPARQSHFLSFIQISCGTHNSVFSFIAAVN